MTLIMFSLGSAVIYGAADFFGGAASRRASARSVLMVSLPIGLIGLAVAALATESSLSSHDAVWGLAAGLAGGAGLFVFYGALARGPMSVVAPVAALVSALLPVAAGLLRGERPGPSVLLGVGICLAAICLVSMEEPSSDGDRARPARSARGPIMAALAGACFGVFFIMLREAGRDGGLWALVASRASGFAVVIVVGLVGWTMARRVRPLPRPARPGRSSEATEAPEATNQPEATPLTESASLPGSASLTETAPLPSATKGTRSASPAGPVPGRLILTDPAALSIALLAGILDSLANLLYLFATRAGMLSLAAALTSLYPAITVLLARVIYSERLRTVQRLGVVLALLGVALVTAG
jgi:drug/metabolite transporter (DMT)-like permease